MAWNIHWQCCFKSFGGTQYAVNIYEQNYSGSIVQLTGASEPFVTQEDNDDDIFKPIRMQTGYLRVIDYDGTLMESIIPSSNTEKLVRLVQGNYTGTYPSGSFSGSTIRWQGFLQAQAYTQPWEDNANVIEFPVKSVFGALEDVQLNQSNAAAEYNIATFLIQCCSALNLSVPTDMQGCTFLTDVHYFMDRFLTTKLQWAVFFQEETINNQGDSFAQIIGISFYDALSYILTLFGLTVREDGANTIFAQYDTISAIRTWQSSWVVVNRYAEETGTSIGDGNLLPSVQMLNSSTFKGIDNVKGFLPGRKSAKIELTLQDGISLHINLPQTTEDTSTVYEVEDIYSGQVFVQPHSPRSNSIESFSFYEYQQSGSSTSNLVGNSNYQNCLNNSVIFRPLYNPHYSSSDNLHTGAFPCRWYYKKDASDLPTLKNGLFLNQQWLDNNWSFTPNYCYSIKSSLSYKFTSGYLNINLMCYNFMRGKLAGDSDKLYFGEFTSIWSTKPQTKLYCILTWGNKEWNGTQWITHSGNYNTFTIDFDGASVKTNKTTDMQVEGNSGWYIPITEEMSGQVRLYILNVADTTGGMGHYDAHSKIIADFIIEYLPPIGLVESQRSQNTYRHQIMTSGFSNEKEISLRIGTYNNNKQSVSFLKTNSTTYRETYEYFNNSEGTTYAEERPELHLLSRLVAYYNQVRRTFRGVFAYGLDLLNQRYSYLGRNFFGIAEQTNWADDKQEVKFIEVT